jgi:Uma2 family endonuclease
MALPLPKLTVAQYLAIERQAEYKSEFYKGEMFPMPGGTANHSELAVTLGSILRVRLMGRACKVFNSDLKVRTGEDGLYTYPDVSVVCGERIFADDETDVLLNPKLIVEVLSKSNEAHDRGFKFREYKKIASLEEYILVSQFEPLIERFRREPGGLWISCSEAHGMDATLVLESLGLEIPLAEIYRDIEL